MGSNPSAAPVNATSIGGVAVSGTPAANKLIDATSATAAAWTTYLDATAADILTAGNQLAGANGFAADSGHVHPASKWVPSGNGLLASNMDPMAASSVILVTAGTLYLLRVDIFAPFTWTNVWLGVTTAGNNTGGSAGTFVGLYSSAGTLLSGSADVASSFTSTGAKSLPLTTPQALAAGTYVWVAVLANLGTTQPTFQRAPSNPAAVNANQAAGALRSCVNGTGLTALPSPSITPGSNTATNSQPLWVGAS